MIGSGGSLHAGLAGIGLVIGSAVAVLAARPWGSPAAAPGVRRGGGGGDAGGGGGGGGGVRRRVVVAALGVLLGVGAIAYLSVPDTEGQVLVLSILLPVTIAAAAGRSRWSPRALIGVWVAMGTVLVVSTWRSAGSGVSVSGWWPAKVAAALVALASVAVLARELRTSGRARRSR